jgi:DNA polymerase III sliding clamp (beta) subunit (PCNA family)
MHIVNTKDLKKAVQAIGAVSKGKKSLKVLEYVTLEGRHGGYLSITGTDLETAVKIDIPAAISGNTAAVAVHYKTLADGLKGMKENQVSIKIDESGQVMLSGTESGDIIQSVFDIAEYPVTPEVKKWASFSVSTREFLTGLETIFFTIDKDEPRPHFRGGLLHLKDEYINMVGTDTKQLIIKKVQYQNGLVLSITAETPEKLKDIEPENIRKVLIPHDSIKKLLSILKGASGMLEVIADNQYIRIYGKDIIVTCLLFGNPEVFSVSHKISVNKVR